MVRVISQGFNTPRSRHSSGEEMIDRFAAMKAVSALNENEKTFYTMKHSSGSLIMDCNTDTNDSFSANDSEEESKAFKSDDADLVNNNSEQTQDHVKVKKERRRERNKLSAQNYRQRRRQQTSAAEKTLESLEARHKILLENVRHLESEKHIVEEYLKNCVRIPWCPYHHTSKPSPPPTIPEDGPCPGACAQPCEETSGAHSIPASIQAGVCNANTPMFMRTDQQVPMSMRGDDNNNNMPLSMTAGGSSLERCGSSVS